MKASIDCVKIIEHFEGFKPYPYMDDKDGWTIGIGSMNGLDGKPVTADHRAITLDEARTLVLRDVNDAEKGVAKLITTPLTQNEHDAMVSFTYNLGSGNLQSSTLRRKLNAGDKQGAATEFGRWIYDDGKVERGLVRRRKSEAHLFTTGEVNYFEES